MVARGVIGDSTIVRSEFSTMENVVAVFRSDIALNTFRRLKT